MLFYPPIELFFFFFSFFLFCLVLFFSFVLISPIIYFPLIRAPMLHRLPILSVLVFILLLVYHAYVLLLEHCHFVCFQFLTLWFTPCDDLDAHCFCPLLSFPLEWVMWKYCHCVWGLVIVWDDFNCSLIFTHTDHCSGHWPRSWSLMHMFISR